MRLIDNSFIIIFGSYARKDYTNESDIDVLLINSNEIDANKILINNVPNLPINYVSYNWETFFNFYAKGSLFLFHIFNQGIVIKGNNSTWNNLSKNFKVKKNFDEEISIIKNDISVYHCIDIFDGYYLSALSNIFPLFKNYCIFSLANMKIYEFNKNLCINSMNQFKQQNNNFLNLQKYYNVVVKELSIQLPFEPESKDARKLLTDAYNYVWR